MSEKNIVVKNKDGDKVEIKKPQTPPPKVIIEYASLYERKNNSKKNNTNDK